MLQRWPERGEAAVGESWALPVQPARPREALPAFLSFLFRYTDRMSTTMVKMRTRASLEASLEGRGRAPSPPLGACCEASSSALPLPLEVPPGAPHGRPAIVRAGPAPRGPQRGKMPLRRLLRLLPAPRAPARRPAADSAPAAPAWRPLASAWGAFDSAAAPPCGEPGPAAGALRGP